MGTVVERAFRGEFETHLTVRLDADTVTRARLARWAEHHGLKLTRIVLDRGAMPDQPMLTEQGRGTLAEQRAAARLRSAELRAAGFSVVRVKIEAAPWNEDIPRTTDEAAELSPVCHFEHHIKLLLSGEPEVASARAVAQRHSAHLSRNARRAARHGRHERFVTQRCRAVGRPEARARLDALLGALAAAGLEVAEVEEEFVVHDDHPAVDAGWIDERTEQRAGERGEQWTAVTV
ncbi:hypothetical protein [Streptomyces sp. NBC_00154]|uniref:hypothetical protein n=1 Tax=Streptomyces sp. NBC_00154 TaxID=2975670 RepID=UPI0022516118|nr:hypothetical protein [Streptomyces sp. NBC_00154]MCX5309804.1 hypothetical protein [Streptomyces sp. NBC_00154]